MNNVEIVLSYVIDLLTKIDDIVVKKNFDELDSIYNLHREFVNSFDTDVTSIIKRFLINFLDNGNYSKETYDITCNIIEFTDSLSNNGKSIKK